MTTTSQPEARESLISALQGVIKGRIPDTQNLLRLFHHDYVKTGAMVSYNATGKECVRRYWLEITEDGRNLLDALE